MSDDNGSVSGPTNDEELAKVKKRQKDLDRQVQKMKKGLHDLDPGSDLYEALKAKIERQEAEAQRHRIMNEIQDIYDAKED
ncbi:TPA: hypothetical protein ACXJQL_001790 [Stenotrophomonas maltophilia]